MSFWTDKRVLVTGSTGFVGKALCARLKIEGAQAFGTERPKYDLVNYVHAESLFETVKPEIVFHLAAITGGIGFHVTKRARIYADNLNMGMNVLGLSADYRVKTVITVGTACSYPENAPMPLNEDTLWDGLPEHAGRPYGMAKRALLTAAHLYAAENRFRSVYVIPTNIYGPGDNFDLENGHVIPSLIAKCVDAKKSGAPSIQVWGSGGATRDFIYIDDAVNALLSAAAGWDNTDPVNIGSGREVAIALVAEIIADIVGFEGDLLWNSRRLDGSRRRVLNIDRSYILGLSSSPMTLVRGIQKTVEAYIGGLA